MKPTKRKSNLKSTSAALRELLLEGSVGTQDDICSVLQKQGYEVNQPKVSRLLHKIGAIKVTSTSGQAIYRLPHAHGLTHELNRPLTRLPARQWVFSVTHNNAIVVIHTTPGAGALVAREIDLHHDELGILGSIAGDDTIFIAPRDTEQIKQVAENIKVILEL